MLSRKSNKSTRTTSGSKLRFGFNSESSKIVPQVSVSKVTRLSISSSSPSAGWRNASKGGKHSSGTGEAGGGEGEEGHGGETVEGEGEDSERESSADRTGEVSQTHKTQNHRNSWRRYFKYFVFQAPAEAAGGRGARAGTAASGELSFSSLILIRLSLWAQPASHYCSW